MKIKEPYETVTFNEFIRKTISEIILDGISFEISSLLSARIYFYLFSESSSF